MNHPAEKIKWAVLQVQNLVFIICFILVATITFCSLSVLKDCYAQVYLSLFAITIIVNVMLMIESILKPEEGTFFYEIVWMGCICILMACNGIGFIFANEEYLSTDSCEDEIIYEIIKADGIWFLQFGSLALLPLIVYCYVVTRKKELPVEKNPLEESLL
jgi:hypothetical protein